MPLRAVMEQRGVHHLYRKRSAKSDNAAKTESPANDSFTRGRLIQIHDWFDRLYLLAF
jgi:hypothetical protein